MNNRQLILLTALCVLTAPAAAEERRYTLLEREIEYLMELWPGDYDNREQVQFAANVGKATEEQGGPPRMHSQIRRVEDSPLGEYVLYVENFRDNNPENVTRQSLFQLVPDETENAVRVRIHRFTRSKRWLGEDGGTDGFAELTPEDTALEPGCDLLLKRDVDAIAGGTVSQDCREAAASGNGFLDYQVRISQDGYWFRERRSSEQSAAAEQSWLQLERVRWFQCMVDFPREDGGRPINTVDYVRIHDQGGTYPFTYRDGREMVFTFRNTWSYGMQRETLVIVVQEGDETGSTLVYGWAEPGSDRIGVNPGWIRLQCDLDTPKTRKFQHWLRPDS